MRLPFIPSPPRTGGARILRRRLLALFVFVLATAPDAAAAAAAARASAAAADSVDALRLPPQIIVGERVPRVAAGGALELDAVRIRDRSESSVAELAPLLPSTRLGVNSRGEAQFMLRGASERHLAVRLEALSLTIPWDERADLSLLPLDLAGSVTLTRGVAGVLDPPGALAGVVRLRCATPESDGWRTRLSGQAAEGGLRDCGALQLLRLGAWRITAAASRRVSDGFPKPGGWTPAGNETADALRLNSDYRRDALGLHVERPVAGDGRLSFTWLESRSEKGVPPEAHLGDDARFWRYPDSRRSLFGLGVERRVDPAGDWRFAGAVSFDCARGEILTYGDASYTATPLAAGDDHEVSRDRCLEASLRLRRDIPGGRRLTLGARVRRGSHRETLEVAGPDYVYAQVLGACGVEYAWPLAPGWSASVGAAREMVDTPDAGGKPAREAQGAGVWRAGVSRTFAGGELSLCVSRRGRFPSLRESYSGALGKFRPNPDLGPEMQNLIELGGGARRGTLSLAAAVFAFDVEGGIEKVRNDDGTFSRVNVDRLRAFGCELSLAWRPARGMSLTAHHGVFRNRRRDGAGLYSLPVEDRPDFLSSLSLEYTRPCGLRLRLEAQAVGRRHGADATDETDGLTRLPAGGKLSCRVGWLRHAADGPLRSTELFVRVDNLTDETVLSQVGLPEPGRLLRLGVNLELGS